MLGDHSMRNTHLPIPRKKFSLTAKATDKWHLLKEKEGYWHHLFKILFGPALGSIKTSALSKVITTNSHYDLIEKLLKDPYLKPYKHNNQVLALAVKAKNLPAVKMLLKDPRLHPEDPNKASVVLDAVEKYAIEILKELLKDPRINPTALDQLALTTALEKANPEMVQALLAHPKINPGYHHNMAIALAAEKGNLDIVKMLLKDSRVDPTDYLLKSALEIAVKHLYLDIVKELIKDPRITTDQNYKNAWDQHIAEVNHLKHTITTRSEEVGRVSAPLRNYYITLNQMTLLLGAGIFLKDRPRYHQIFDKTIDKSVIPYIAILLPFSLPFEKLLPIAKDMSAHSTSFREWKTLTKELLSLPASQALDKIQEVANDIEGTFKSSHKKFRILLDQKIDPLAFDAMTPKETKETLDTAITPPSQSSLVRSQEENHTKKVSSPKRESAASRASLG